MSKTRFFSFNSSQTIAAIAEIVGGKIRDSQKDRSNLVIENISNLEDSSEGDLTFVSNRKYYNLLKTSKATACIVPIGVEIEANPEIVLIECEDAYYAYSKSIDFLYKEKKTQSPSPISLKVKIGKNVKIGHNVIIEDNVEIGDDTEIDSNVVIKYGVNIGRNCKIGAGSYISYALIGDDVIIHSGVRIGTDGFGFATYKGVHNKILHVGSVKIADKVEIGANSTIDRGSNKDTVIGAGTIIDNLVQIGHNVQLGKGCIIVAQVGIAGSSILEDYVVVGGQVGIAGHLHIASQVQIAGKSGVISNIDTKAQIVGGYPSQPIRDWHKQTILLRKMLKENAR